MKVTIKDIIAVSLTIISILIYSSQYFIYEKLGDFKDVYSWISIILLFITVVYLYLNYLKK